MQQGEAAKSSLAWVGLAGVIALFSAMMAGFFVPAYEGVDENGYLCAARRIALTGSAAKHTVHPLEHVSSNVVQVEDTVFYPKYPLGYPWLCAAAYRVGGPDLAFWVNPILAGLGVAGIFFLGRALVNAFAGLLAALLLATNPLHAAFGLSALSHSGAICFAIWGVFFLWQWSRHGGWGNAFLAGASLGFTYTVRYSEALLVVPVLAMVLWRRFSLPEGASPAERTGIVQGWRRGVGCLLLGAVVATAPLLIHHWIAFGAPWRTGYDLCGESTGFGWNYFKENWWLMLTRLNTPGLLLLFPVGLAGLAYLAAHDPKRGTLLLAWFLPPVLLYTAYYWAPQGEGRGYVRFFVSVFPPLIIGALALLVETMRSKRAAAFSVGTYVAIVASFNLRESLQDLDNWHTRLRNVRQLWTTVRERVPTGAIVVSQQNTLNHLEFTGDYELYATESFDQKAIQQRLKVLDHSDPHPMQRRKVLELARVTANQTDTQLAGMLRSLLTSNVAAGRMVAVISTQDQFRNVRGRLGDAFHYAPVINWEIVAPAKRGAAPKPVVWNLYELEPRSRRAAASNNVVQLEEQVDQLQFRIRTLRAALAEQFPEAHAKYGEIEAAERQLREKREQLRTRAARRVATAAAHLTSTNPQPKEVPTP